MQWLGPAAEMAAAAREGWACGPAESWCAGYPRVATRTPGIDAGCVRAARDFTGATLERWRVTDRRDDIVVVVSELLTNALRHAVPRPGARAPRRPIRLGLLQPGPYVMCAVADPSTRVPAPRSPDCLEENGRGLHVIASLSDEWGCTMPSPLGKIVWATFATDW